MRKPRDIDSELKALQDKAKGLKARKATQLGELVAATGAHPLEPETLAGALLTAAENGDAAIREGWGRRGTEFFQRQGRPRKAEASATSRGSRAAADDSRHAPR